jgi:S-DNA-T family DNA segregation ATPase FtsK/SpoIIIE
VAAVLVAVFIASKRHEIGHVCGQLVHILVLVGLVFAAAAVLAAAVVWLVSRKLSHRAVANDPARGELRRRNATARLRYLPAALWARARFRWLVRNLGDAFPDRHRQGKVRFPRALIYPGPHGIVARVRTVPGVGREEFDADSQHIANAWKCHRVRVSQPKPGRVTIHGYRADPLAAPLGFAALPPFDGRHITLGVDEFGELRRVSLANLSGAAFSGSPGRGKTEAALSLVCQLAPSGLADLYILDGGACDWAHFADGAAGYVADDLDAAADMLHELAAGMSQRRRNLEQDLGVRNGWRAGPSPGYRLRFVLMEEAPFYLDNAMVKGDRKREALVATCVGLTGGLLRRGRAPLYFTSLIAQKGTGTGGLPPDLRDLCGARWSFGVATLQAAAAVLGPEISDYPSLSPVTLQDSPGIATVLLPTGTSPYTLVKFPEVGEARADQAAAELAAARAAETVPPGRNLIQVPAPLSGTSDLLLEPSRA